MPGDTLKRRFEQHFLAANSSLEDEVVDISQQVAALSVVDCADIVTQLLTYFDAYVRQVKVKVSYVVEICFFYVHWLTTFSAKLSSFTFAA